MRRSTSPWAVFIGVLAACGPGKAGDTGDSASTDSTVATLGPATLTSPMTATSDPGECLDAPPTGGNDTGTDTDPTDTAGPLVCPPVDGQPCTAPIDCANETCGSHVSAFDPHGCPRRPCALDAECGVGEGCLLQSDSSSPLHAVACAGTPDACNCQVTAEPLAGVCMPEALLPDNFLAHCDTLKTAVACTRFDVAVDRYCRWLPTSLSCGESCKATGESAACIGFAYVGDGCAGASCTGVGRGYARLRPGGSELFFNPVCGDEPQGWVQCVFGDEAPACCVCGQD